MVRFSLFFFFFLVACLVFVINGFEQLFSTRRDRIWSIRGFSLPMGVFDGPLPSFDVSFGRLRPFFNTHPPPRSYPLYWFLSFFCSAPSRMLCGFSNVLQLFFFSSGCFSFGRIKTKVYLQRFTDVKIIFHINLFLYIHLFCDTTRKANSLSKLFKVFYQFNALSFFWENF